VLNAEGASLNPLRLLAALPGDMPLHLAGDLLGQMVVGLQHRHRYGQIVRWAGTDGGAPDLHTLGLSLFSAVGMFAECCMIIPQQ
jgi:hypothetical protein